MKGHRSAWVHCDQPSILSLQRRSSSALKASSLTSSPVSPIARDLPHTREARRAFVSWHAAQTKSAMPWVACQTTDVGDNVRPEPLPRRACSRRWVGRPVRQSRRHVQRSAMWAGFYLKVYPRGHEVRVPTTLTRSSYRDSSSGTCGCTTHPARWNPEPPSNRGRHRAMPTSEWTRSRPWGRVVAGQATYGGPPGGRRYPS